MPADAATADAPAAAPDAVCQRLSDALRAELGPAVLGVEIQRREIVARVQRDAWYDAVATCKRKLGFDYFCFLSGLDWLDNPAQTTRYENVWGTVDDDADEGAPDEAAPDEGAPDAAAPDAVAPDASAAGLRTGLAGGDSRFQVFARLVSTKEHRGITLKADLAESDPRVPTISTLFAGADWHEREAWEMYGFGFDGHPHLVHIYLPGAFEGHPLRKDFPLLAREVKPWPGLTNVEPIAGEADAAEGEG